MKSINKKISTKKIVIFSLIALLIAGSGVVAAYYVYNSNSNSDKPSANQENSGNDSPEPNKNESNSDSTDKEEFLDNESNPSNPNTTPSFNSDKVALEIAQTTTAVNISTKLTNFSGAGTCELKLIKSSSSIVESAEIIYQPEYSTCAGFSINKSRLSAGTWTVNLTVSSEGKSYSQSSEFTIK